MSMLNSSENLGIPVEVGAIDGELKKLWEADEASTNASLMNFLVYTEDPSRLQENSQTIQELTRENACRAVLIAMNRKATDVKVESWITAHCHLAHGKKSICSEQVSFLLHGKSLGRLRNTVFAHLNSDLPLVFWWQGEFSELFEERLYRLLDRLIFDSSDWADPKRGFRRLLKARSDTKGGMVTQDLSWTRSYYYRLAVARLFDDPMAHRAFPEIEKVRVKAQSKHRIAALLMLAWVVTRSGWSVQYQETGRVILESSEGREVVVELIWDDEGAPISELEISAPNFKARISREAGNSHLCQSIRAESHSVDFSGPADYDDSAGLVASQLSRGGKNSLFLNVLPQFMELLEGGR
ncbi:glucose-6-phosphate dehydrogenase assembly protein OpcA [Akkermansiaceae bacterium]|nr:glucose-6-phosphate dehydrogenase assembly protein OpcA [Akkermansiaceae bacterium]MDB4487850.1 glucose-6-phosphate dehydrogenase assembly protein OpcA [Akkermansiaceae bacterium]